MKPEQVIGRQIRAIRESRSMTQQELGERLGELLPRAWPRQAVSSAERGERAFTGAELLAVAHVLQTWIGALMMPPIEVDRIDMPSGASLTRSDVERTALDPETRNVLPDAMEAIRKAAVRLNEGIKQGVEELEELRDVYASLTINRTVPTDGLAARQAQLDDLARDAWDRHPEQEAGRNE